MKRPMIRRLLCLPLALLLASISSGEDWGSLRGPHFDGSAATDRSDLATGPLRLKVVWKRDLGSGYSGAVKSGNRLVTAMADRDSDQEFVVALATDSGKTLWQTPTGKIYKGENGSFDGPIATPAVDERQAYHLSPFGDLAAYSLESGEVVWSRNLKTDFSVQPNFYGFGASPIVYSNLLIVPVGSSEGAVMAFNTTNGEVVWKVGEDTASFQSAVLVELEGADTVVVAGDTQLFAIDPTTGKLRWSRPHGGANGMPAWAVVPVPLKGGGLFLNDGRNGSTALQTTGEGASERWSGREIRNTYCVPVNAGGLLCSYSSRFLTAVDPASGKRLWRTRAPSNGFLGTVAGRLVVATMNGSLHVGDVTEDGFEEIVSTEVFESGDKGSEGLLWSLPSFGGESVYLRSLGALARVDIQPGESAANIASTESQLGPRFQSFIERLKGSDDKEALIQSYLDQQTLPIIEDDIVHFVLQGDFEDVAVAGDLFGVRQERSMLQVPGTDLFYYGTKLPKIDRASYVFFADYQPMLDPRNPRQVLATTLAGEMEPSFMGPAEPLKLSWFDVGDSAPDANWDSSKSLAGTLEKASLDSKLAKETVGIQVYLPPGYADADPSTRYPVVFVHDGAVAQESGVQAVIVDDLIQKKVIRPTVVVFIEKRFFPLMGAPGYGEMFGQELIPMIESSYRVSQDRNDRASLGGGFGATLGIMATLPISDQVGRIGCHTPFAFELIHPQLQQLASMKNSRCKVLVQAGSYDLRNPGENWDMKGQAKTVADLLKQGGHEVTFEEVPMGSDWVCWRTQSARMWRELVGP